MPLIFDKHFYIYTTNILQWISSEDQSSSGKQILLHVGLGWTGSSPAILNIYHLQTTKSEWLSSNTMHVLYVWRYFPMCISHLKYQHVCWTIWKGFNWRNSCYGLFKNISKSICFVRSYTLTFFFSFFLFHLQVLRIEKFYLQLLKQR